MHLDEEQLQRLLDGEVSRADSRVTREHVGQCADCRSRLEAARVEDVAIDALLRRLDHAMPLASSAAIVERATRRRRRLLGRAAAVMLMLGLGSVAWAAPQSPMPRLVHAVIASFHHTKQSEPPRARPTPPVPAMAGIAVVPGAHLVVEFTSSQTAGAVRVSLNDDADVVVRGPAGAAPFTSSDGRVVIDNVGSRATFEVGIPRAAPSVDVRIASVAALLKRGPAISAPSATRSGSTYVIPLTPSR